MNLPFLTADIPNLTRAWRIALCVGRIRLHNLSYRNCRLDLTIHSTGARIKTVQINGQGVAYTSMGCDRADEVTLDIKVVA